MSRKNVSDTNCNPFNYRLNPIDTIDFVFQILKLSVKVQRSLKLIYYLLVYTTLSYSIVIWGKLTQHHTKIITTAQKKIERSFMFRDRYRYTNNDLYNLGFLKFIEILKYFASIFTYKSLNNIAYPFNYFQTT